MKNFYLFLIFFVIFFSCLERDRTYEHKGLVLGNQTHAYPLGGRLRMNVNYPDRISVIHISKGNNMHRDLESIIVYPGPGKKPATYPDGTKEGDEIFEGYKEQYPLHLDEIVRLKNEKSDANSKQTKQYQLDAAKKGIINQQ